MELVELKNKIGVGIITCGEADMYADMIQTFPYEDVGRVYVYDLTSSSKYVKHRKNITPISGRRKDDTVAVAKNRIIKRMIDDGYEHIFIITDGVKIKNGGVFEQYIATAEDFGMMGGVGFGWLGANIDLNGIPIIKNHIMGHNGLGVAFYHNFTSTFTYYNKIVFEEVGDFDETMGNTWADLDFYYRMSKNQLTSLWWWFPDITDSKKYLTNVERPTNTYISVGTSKLTTDEELTADIVKFVEKHNCSPLQMKHPNEFDLLGHIRNVIDHANDLRGRSIAPIDIQENLSQTELSGE